MNLPKPKPPCKDCADRYPGCHAECEMYKAFRTGREKLYEENLLRVYGNPDSLFVIRNEKRKQKAAKLGHKI